MMECFPTIIFESVLDQLETSDEIHLTFIRNDITMIDCVYYGLNRVYLLQNKNIIDFVQVATLHSRVIHVDTNMVYLFCWQDNTINFHDRKLPANEIGYLMKIECDSNIHKGCTDLITTSNFCYLGRNLIALRVQCTCYGHDCPHIYSLQIYDFEAKKRVYFRVIEVIDLSSPYEGILSYFDCNEGQIKILCIF